MHRHVKRFAPLLTVLLLAPACGGGAAPVAGPPTTLPAAPTTLDPATANVHACKLVTNDEAERALGMPVNDGVETVVSGGTTSCTWTASTAKGAGEGITIVVEPTTIFDNSYGNAGGSSSAFVIAPVQGIGDEAFTQTSKSNGSDTAGDLLQVKKGEVALSFSVSSKTLTRPEVLTIEKLLAVKATARL